MSNSQLQSLAGVAISLGATAATLGGFLPHNWIEFVIVSFGVALTAFGNNLKGEVPSGKS